MSLLRVDDLHVSYRRGGAQVHAVAGVSLEIARDETLGLVGESGCGKSTLGKAILRLVDARSGRIVFDGVDITQAGRSSLRPFRRRMQIVFQDPYGSLNPRTSVGDLIAAGLVVHKVGSKESRAARVSQLLRQVGLPPEHAARRPHEFSGGQRQRIGIARALALSPDFLVCDEPVSALDVSVRSQVLNLLVRIQRELGLAMLFISHDLAVVRYVADRVAVLYLGKIVETAPVADLFETPRHPYTRALLQAMPSVDRVAAAFAGAETLGDLPSAARPPSGCRFHPRCPIATERCAREEPVLRAVGRSAVACHFAT
jgi:peptide/nickel transport system ATP-binding protein